MAALSFKIVDFEGPLDLLLHLISKHKLNILDIEISELLRQYMLFFEDKPPNLDVSSEFLEMASRLVHIKSVTLLPKHEDEAAELKTALSQELMEYQLCKLLAAQLSERERAHRVYVRTSMPCEADLTYRGRHTIAELFTGLNLAKATAARKAPPPAETFTKLVRRRAVSVSSRIIFLLRRLYRSSCLAFNELFKDQKERSEIVATFLALLELLRSGRIYMSDDGERFSLDRTSRKGAQV